MRLIVKLTLIALLTLAFAACGGEDKHKGHEGHKHSETGKAEESGEKAKAETQIWTCSMHPQVRQPENTKCPICAMDLIPLTDEGSGDSPILKLNSDAIKLAEVETETAGKGLLARSIMLTGKIVEADTGVKSLTARFPGRVDRVFVKYEGAYVRKGMPLAKIYSPSLITSQQEFLTVAAASGRKGRLYEAAKNRLLLLGITEGQVKALLKKGKPSPWMTVLSTVEGFVKKLNVIEGDYLKKGSRLFILADLKHLWGEFNVYGADLQWIKYGQKIVIESEAGKGKLIEGRVSFVQPFFDSRTRVAKVRADIKNSDGVLKPGMFIRARTGALMDAEGKIYDEELADSWISPVKPDVITDKAGLCSVSGAPLVKTSKYGYAGEAEVKKLLMIPDTAPLITGKRAVVYIAMEEGKFEGREVVLGKKGDSYYEVLEGISAGDEVVVKGAFKLDSELQIKAKPSMMSSDGSGALSPGFLGLKKKMYIPEKIVKLAGEVVEAYFPVQKALADDDFKKAINGDRQFLKKVKKMLTGSYSAGIDRLWKKKLNRIVKAALKFKDTPDIGEARVVFEELTHAVESMVLRFGSGDVPVYRINCPMAFDDRGAYWLQRHDDVFNPYFGDEMLKCSDTTELISPKRDER